MQKNSIESNFCELIAHAQSGSQEAMTYLYIQHKGLIVKNSFVCGAKDEDLEQELSAEFCKFVKTFRVLEYEEEEKTRAIFLFLLSKRLISRNIDYIRKHECRIIYEAGSIDDEANECEERIHKQSISGENEVISELSIMDQLESKKLFVVINKLDNMARSVLIDKVCYGVSLESYAKQNRQDIRDVRNAYRRAKSALRRKESIRKRK